MNRVYKVIWSKAKHCYVVTSEIARSVTKSASSARSAGRKGAAVLAMAALLFTAGGVLGEAAPNVVTDVSGSREAQNLIIVTRDDGKSTNFAINNVDHATEADHAKEADYATAATKATSDGNGHVIENTYVKNVDARVGADGEYVKVANTVGKNLSALDTNLSALDAQVKKNTLAVAGVVEAGEKVGEKLLDLDKQIKVNAKDNLKVGDDGVISKVTGDDSTPSSPVNKLVLNVDGNNRITIDEKGIKVGTNSTVIASDGVFAGGDTAADAKAALNANGSIKGASGKFTVEADGKVTAASGKIGNVDITSAGAVSGVTDLTVTGTFDSKTLSSTLDAKNDYTTINGGKTQSMNWKMDAVTGETQSSASTFDENGSNAWAKDDDSIGKSTVTADGISQKLSDPGDNPQAYAERAMSQGTDKKYSMVDTVKDGDKTNVASQTASESSSVVSGKDNESIIKQTETGIKSIATDGTNNASTNLSNEGFNTFASDGTNKTYTKQTAVDIKNTAEKGMISNKAKNLVNRAYENMTNTVGKDLTTTVGGNKSETVTGTSTETVTSKKTENYNGGLETTVTGDEKHTVNGSQTTTVTGDSSLSAKNITNTATTTITDKVGKNTSWEMTDGTVVESVKDASGKTNQTTTTAADTYQFVKDGDNTLAKRTSSTNDNLNITDGTNTYTKITTATGNKQTVTGGTETASTNLTKAASNTLIENGTQSVLDHMAADTSYTVMNENGNGSRRQQTASEILDRVTDGTDTSEVKQTASEVAASAKNISNTATDKITSQIGDGSAVKSEMTAKGITNTAKDGTITNDAKDLVNTASNSITDKVGENVERTMGTKQIQDKVGKTTVTTTDGLTELTNKDRNHKTVMDYANVTKDLNVNGDATVDQKLTVKGDSDLQGNATVGKNLEVKGTSTLKGDVTMESNATVKKDLTVNGKSTFNDKVTIKKNGLDVKDGTTTDTLTVTGTSEFRGKADFKDNVSMGKGLAVAGETKTGTLHVEKDGYVGGNLNVAGNIETHDAELSENSRQVVTGRQLYQTNERVDRLDNRIKKVGANAAALAALRPGDFNPDDKFSIAAGFGSYRNANAAALGLFYRPNENVLLSLGTSFGDGENMVNAGVSVKFGRGKSMAERRKEMADEVSSMRDEMRSQDERIAELEEMLKKQSELIEKLSKES